MYMDISAQVDQVRSRSTEHLKNTVALAQLLKTINDYPDKSVQKYCDLTGISYPTFFRYVRKLREIGLLHDKYYRVLHPVSAPVVKSEAEKRAIIIIEAFKTLDLAKAIASCTNNELSALSTKPLNDLVNSNKEAALATIAILFGAALFRESITELYSDEELRNKFRNENDSQTEAVT